MRPERARRDVLLIAEIVVGEDEAEAINLAIVALRVIREAITLDQSQLVCVGEGEKREKKRGKPSKKMSVHTRVSRWCRWGPGEVV